MSSFLAALAARAIAPKPALRPVVQPVFSRVSADDVVAAVSEERGERPARPSLNPDAAAVAEQPAQPRITAGTPKPAPTVAQVRTSDEKPTPTPPVAEPPTRRAEVITHEIATTRRDVQVEQVLTREQTVVREVRVASPQPLPPASAAVRPADVPVKVIEQRASVQPAAPSPKREEPAAREAVRTAPVLTPRSIAPAPVIARAEPAVSETVVNITIGRVDVRAVTAPAAPNPRAAAAPRNTAMSLDDYLRQREQRRP